MALSIDGTFLNLLCHPTFYVLPLSLQVFLEAESVVAAELSPEAFALVFVAAGLSPEVVCLGC